MPPLALTDLVPDHIRTFEGYIPSRPDDVLKALYGCATLHRLNNNENPLGPSPAARLALESLPAVRAHQYPSGDAYHLRCALAERHGLDPDQIVVGNGANEVIAFVIKTFCREGDNIVTADRTFAVYEWLATFSGVEARLAPLVDFGFDAGGLLERMDSRTKVIFLCNPNNPTGSLWRDAAIRAFLDGVDGRCVVVLDEAYIEFVAPGQAPDSLALLREYPNLVLFRTFSKAFALAGLRIGYLMASGEVAALIRKPCIVYSVNGPSQIAAQASLEDAQDFLPLVRDHTVAARRRFTADLRELGLSHVAGEGNFVMVRLPMNDGLAYRRLMTRGIMVRAMAGFRCPGWVRISLGLPEAMEACRDALVWLLSERDP